MYELLIGIDPGVNTGFSLYDPKTKRLTCKTAKIHTAMKEISYWVDKFSASQVFVRVEDARLRKWFGKSGKERLKGAGSITRDSKIWEDFLEDLGVEYELVPPKNNTTKLDAKTFQMITGYTGRTSEHARDSAMLVYKFNPKVKVNPKSKQ
jgi:hypothetical protein